MSDLRERIAHQLEAAANDLALPAEAHTAIALCGLRLADYVLALPELAPLRAGSLIFDAEDIAAFKRWFDVAHRMGVYVEVEDELRLAATIGGGNG